METEIHIALSNTSCNEVRDFLLEEIMRHSNRDDIIYFAGISIDVLDVADETLFTKKYMAEHDISEPRRFDKHINVLDMSTRVFIKCSPSSLLFDDFFLICNTISRKISKQFNCYSLVLVDFGNEEHALYKSGVFVDA
jgi:hypothetical protein